MHINSPNEKDCWMNFTEKIAEQCNGAAHCDLSAQPTYIHKCGKISDYLYVSFQCIQQRTIHNICQPAVHTLTTPFYLKSTDFPTEYPSSLDCTCSLTTSTTANLKLEILWFSLQDNDYLQMFNKNLTNWINPTYEIPILTNSNKIRFLTDDSLAYKGFWLQIAPRKACRDDWQLVGDTCLKVFTENLDWRMANQRCQKMNGNLLKVDDVVADLKLTQYMKSFYPEIDAYWIGLRKYVDTRNRERWMWSANSTNYNDVSWWPWTPRQDKSNEHDPSNCVVKRRNEDGYFTIPCGTEQKNPFICQTNTLTTLEPTENIRLQCGPTYEVEADLLELANFEKIGASSIQNYQTKTKPTPKPLTRSSTTERSILIQPSPEPTTLQAELLKQLHTSTKLNEPIIESKQNDQDPTKQLNTLILAGIIAGIGVVIVIINLAVLIICRRNLKKFLKTNKENKLTKPDQPTSDMLQDYFEAFSTLHNLKYNPNISKMSPQETSAARDRMINDINAFTLNHQKALQSQAQNRTVSINSGDEPLMNESAKLFYNSQQFLKNMTLKQTEAALANTSAFKPFIREVNDKNISQQQLLPMETLLARNHFIQQQLLQGNQYDKISHIQAGQMPQNLENQYAHTYECLDSNGNPEVKRNHLSPQFDPQFNVSTSSTSSSSGASSTQHLIRNNGQNGQMVQLGGLSDLHMVLNAGGQVFKCACGANNFGDVCGVCGSVGTGAWSPDSAYYSSIPTLGTNYAGCNVNGTQQFSSFQFGQNGENFKSHLV